MACASCPASRCSATTRRPGECRRCAPTQGDIGCDAVVLGPRRLDAEALGDARQADARSTRAIPTATTHAQGHVDLLATARRRGLCRSALSHGGRPRPARAACRAHEHAGDRPCDRQRARRPPLRLLEERRRAHGPARRAGRHHPDQDRPEGGHRSVRPRQRRIPGRARVRRLPDRGDGPAHDRASRARARTSASGATAASARSRPTTCRSSTGSRPTST